MLPIRSNPKADHGPTPSNPGKSSEPSGQKNDDNSVTAPAFSGDVKDKSSEAGIETLDRVKPDDGHSSNASDVVEEIIFHSSSTSDGGSVSEAEGKGKGKEKEKEIEDGIFFSYCRDSIKEASEQISQAKLGFISSGPGPIWIAKEAMEVLPELKRHQMVVNELWRCVVDMVDRRKLKGLIDDEFDQEFLVGGLQALGCCEKCHTTPPETRPRRADGGDGKVGEEGGAGVTWLSAEEYDERVHDRAYLVELLEEQLEELKSDVVAIGISLGEDEVARIVRGREGELVELGRCAERDERLVAGRKRVRRGRVEVGGE